MLLSPLSQGPLSPCSVSDLYNSSIPEKHSLLLCKLCVLLQFLLKKKKPSDPDSTPAPSNTAFYTVMCLCVYCQGKLERLHGVYVLAQILMVEVVSKGEKAALSLSLSL